MFRVACSLVVLVAVLSVGTGSARAQRYGVLSPLGPSATGKKAAQPETEEHAYGHQILLVELAVIVGTLTTRNAGLMAIGIVGGSPLVHAANHESHRAWTSFAVRSAVVGLGLLIHHNCLEPNEFGDPEDCGLVLLFPGMAVTLAMGLIEAMIAKREVVVKRPPAGHSRFNPILAPERGGALVGVSFSF